MENIIGLKRGTVKLVPYNPKWAEEFEKEKKLLLNTFGNTILGIEHTGSTSIPGMKAKPIIDIEVGVDSLDTALKMGDQFEKLGYEYRSLDFNKKTSEEVLFIKGPESCRTHHVHVCIYNSSFWKNDIAIRDYLRTHPEKVEEYNNLKIELAKKFANDRKSYTANKKDFLDNVFIIAKGINE